MEAGVSLREKVEFPSWHIVTNLRPRRLSLRSHVFPWVIAYACTLWSISNDGRSFRVSIGKESRVLSLFRRVANLVSPKWQNDTFVRLSFSPRFPNMHRVGVRRMSRRIWLSCRANILRDQKFVLDHRG